MKQNLGVWLGGLSLLCGVNLGCGASDDGGGKQGDGVVQQPTMPTITQQQPAVTDPGAGMNPVMNPVVNSGTGGAASNPAANMGAGGSAGMGNMPIGQAGMPAMQMGNADMPEPGKEPELGQCKDLHTKYAGDEYCILPPPPDKGFQLHMGPSNYDNPEPQYILGPGVETTSDFVVTSTNDTDQYFYYRQIRQRTGAHHNIITSGSGGDIGLGQRIATSNNLAVDDPPGGIIAKENEGVGILMPAHTSITVNLHSINTTEQDELREVWVNFWYVDPAKFKEPVKEIFNIAPMGTILPGADTTFGSSCNVNGTGRMLWAYGHRHANNVRFSIWRQRGAQKDLVYQGYDYEDPLVLDYSSTVMNPVPDTAPGVEGGWSGILDMKPGDQFLWECHVINKQAVALNFTNNTYTGEMCILDAESVGATCN